MTSTEALSGLASIVGGGGIVSVIIAWLGLKQEAMKGRREPDGRTVALAIGDVYAEKRDREAFTQALKELTAVIVRIADLLEADVEMKVSEKNLKATIAVLRSEMKDEHEARDREDAARTRDSRSRRPRPD